MIRILIAGFGRFPGAPFNPSEALAVRLAARRRPALAAHRVRARVFRTSYAAVDDELPRLIARHRPDIVLLLGLAGRTPQVRIETRAQNRMSLVFPDVDGHVPAQASIRPAQDALTGRAPFRRLVAAASAARVRACISRDAGAYLCNFAYFRAIEETSRHRHPPLVVFVHPWPDGTAPSRHAQSPAAVPRVRRSRARRRSDCAGLERSSGVPVRR